MHVTDNLATGFAPRIGRSVSIDHAAQLLKVSRRTVYNRISEGRLRTVRTMGGSQRVLLESVIELHEMLARNGSRKRAAATIYQPTAPEQAQPLPNSAPNLRIVD